MKAKNLKLIKIILLILSTLFFPWQFFGMFFLFIPSLYICFVVPYFIWKIWCGQNIQTINKISLVWKIPTIIFLAFALIVSEIMLIFLIPITMSLVGKVIFFICSVLLVRCLTYAMMIFVWQPNILKSYKYFAYAGVMAYCLAMGYFLYSVEYALDTDDYSVSFYEYMSSKSR